MHDEPLYLHLLSDSEIQALGGILDHLHRHREEVLARLHALYAQHFGGERSLDEATFRALYGRDLDAVARSLADHDLEGFAADMRALGMDLVERAVPFPEVVATLHLFEESAAAVYRPALADLLRLSTPEVASVNVYQAFDKLSHCRLILLASTYFAGFKAQADSRLRSLEREVARLAPGGRRLRLDGLVGKSDGMQRLYDQIERLVALARQGAEGSDAVLLAGESGVGKALVARTLHERAFPGGPFVSVSCTALQRELGESDLFGPRRGGAGAAEEPIGLLRAAGGTLFLDEITELSAELQLKLLRALQQQRGRGAEPGAAAHVVAATSRDPEKAVAAGLLRPELYALLRGQHLIVPPLRERADDVPLLVEHFTELLAHRGLRRVSVIDPEALFVLTRYPWPGNLRELRGAVEHALTVGQGDVLRRVDLPAHLLAATALLATEEASDDGRPCSRAAPPLPPVPTMEQAERDLIVRALAATSGNKLQAARMLRISRHRLYDKLRKFQIGA